MQDKSDDFGKNIEQNASKDLTDIVNEYLDSCPKFNDKPVVVDGRGFFNHFEKAGVRFIQLPNSENEIPNI